MTLSLAFLHFIFFYYAAPLQVERLCAFVWVDWQPANHRMLQAWGEELPWQAPPCSLCATTLTEIIFAQHPSEVLQAGRDYRESQIVSVRLSGFLRVIPKGGSRGTDLRHCVPVQLTQRHHAFAFQQSRGVWYHALKPFMDESFLL